MAFKAGPGSEGLTRSEGAPRARGPSGDAGAEFTLQDPVASFIKTLRIDSDPPVAIFHHIAQGRDFVNLLVFALISALIIGITGLVLLPSSLLWGIRAGGYGRIG